MTYDTNIVASSPRAITAIFPLFPVHAEGSPTSTPLAVSSGTDSPRPDHSSSGEYDDLEGPEADSQARTAGLGPGPAWVGTHQPQGQDGGEAAGRRDLGRTSWGRREGELWGADGADVVRLTNVVPHWNEKLQSYTLNFYSRVKVIRSLVHGRQKSCKFSEILVHLLPLVKLSLAKFTAKI
jgi:hypothetical protein